MTCSTSRRVDPQYGKPFLIAGDLVSATQDRPEVCAVMQYFSTAAGVKGWLAAGGALGPQNDVTLDMYGVPLERTIAELAAAADDRPLRRVRPDARRGRLRLGVEGLHRLLLRRGRPGHGLEEYRRFVAKAVDEAPDEVSVHRLHDSAWLAILGAG